MILLYRINKTSVFAGVAEWTDARDLKSKNED